MKHFRTFVIALAAIAAFCTTTSAFASADYYLQFKNAHGTVVKSVACKNGTWTVDHTPPDTYTVIIVNAEGKDVTGQIRADVKIQGFVVNSHTSAVDLAVFGFEPQPVAAASSTKEFVLPHVLESSGKIGSWKITISNFDDATLLKTRHETAKNSVGNIR
ncbi:MAG: hypothetical protein JSS75_01270 [Bacteroidetes bacterium]|nr:hypothetical protein [Bacteroidota bacterium]